MLIFGIILLVLGIVCLVIDLSDNDYSRDRGTGVVLGLVCLIAAPVLIFWAGHNAGVIDHAAGKYTATRTDNGVSVEWKVEKVGDKK